MKNLSEKREKVTCYYDNSFKIRSDFKEGDSRINGQEKEKYWVPGKILGKCDSPRSYLVRDNFGRVLRRNSSFLRHSPNQCPPIQTQDSFPNIGSEPSSSQTGYTTVNVE